MTAMTFVVNHSISHPEQFWNVLSGNPAVPEGFRVVALMPGADSSKAVCIWQAPNQQQLEELVQKTVGDYSQNSFMEVNVTQAFGLPA